MIADEELKQMMEAFRNAFRHQIKADIGEFVRVDVTKTHVTIVGKENSREFDRTLLEEELKQLNSLGMLHTLKEMNDGKY